MVIVRPFNNCVVCVALARGKESDFSNRVAQSIDGGDERLSLFFILLARWTILIIIGSVK